MPENSALLLAGAPQYFRQPDVLFPYRQDSNFYYLTGFEEPQSFFLLVKKRRGPARSILCVAEKDRKRELWDGHRWGPKKARRAFLMDEAHPINNLSAVLKRSLKGVSTVFYNGGNPNFDKEIQRLKVKTQSAGDFLSPFRQIKDQMELNRMKQAVRISVKAHKATARAIRPGISERALHGVFLKTLMENGSPREGYQSIVACGNNAVTLHYVKNNAVCRKGELLLLDAGGEAHYYTADITRVYPVSGRFSKTQKNLYEKLLSLQKALIRAVRPGVSFKDLNEQMAEGLTNILLELGFLKGDLKDHLKKKSYFPYCPHSVGHLLGMDVHDPPLSRFKTPPLRAGMTLTIEPGFYISKTDGKAPLSLRGTGLRIEDNILVTERGARILTKSAPKETEEVEALCRSV